MTDTGQTTDRRVGVFICYCGGNISDFVDVEKVRDAIENEPGVVVAKTHMFTCADAAQQEMIEDIQNEKIDALVVASCSPTLHLLTFRAMAERAGLNPYQYIQVNLREQCSWTHTDNVERATEKSIRLVRAGIAKSLLTVPLSPLRISTIPKVLIIGAGVAGLRAALAVADLGLQAYIVDKAGEPGGWTGKWGKLFSNDQRGTEIIKTLLEDVKKRENITLFTSAELVAKGGNVGDFSVKIEVGGKETIPLEVGTIIVATGFDSYKPAEGEFGYGFEGVVTLPEFRELIDSSSGSLNYKGRPVKDIAYIYCVGSRQAPDRENPNLYCSRYCCSAVVHSALCVREIDAGLRQYHLFRDMRTYGKYEILYENARNNGSIFIRFADEAPPEVLQEGGKLNIKVRDQLTAGEELEIDADLVVLVTGMVPRENAKLVDILKLPVGKDGFFNEIHPKLRPVETVIDGVFIAGASQSPKTIAESVASSLASVSKSAGLLMKGYIDLEPLIADIDTELCTWCGVCEEACPYSAIEKVSVNGKEIARIIPSLCKGEGACVPICAEEAIDVKGFTDTQIRAMIDTLVKEVV